MRGNHINVSAVLALAAVLTALAPGAAVAQSAGGRCASALQGKVAWNYSGDKNWSPAKIARLCKGAENSAEPARCFRKVMHGGVDWGGGTRWQWRNAVELCQGARNASARIACFKQKVAGQTGWQKAIAQCRKADTLGKLGGLRTAPQSGLREQQGRIRTDRDFNRRKELDRESGSLRFGDGEHGRRPPQKPGGGAATPGGGVSGNITDRPFRERDLERKGAGAPSTADPQTRERLRLKPRITGYRPSTVMQGGEVAVLGSMLGNSKGGRRLVLGVNADPGHGLARELTPRAWTPGEIRARIPNNVLPAKYFIAIVDDGDWVTNRLRTLRVLGRQRVEIKAVVRLRCYAEVTQYPRQLRVTLEPVRPADMGMERGETFSETVRHANVTPGKFGSFLYIYTATADLPHGVFKAGVERPEGASPFKAKDWSRTENSGGYSASKPCAAHRRVNAATGEPLKTPPVFTFPVYFSTRTVRIGPRTEDLELKDDVFADLGALPEPTPVDE